MFRTSFPLPVFFLLYFVFFIYFIFLICCRWVSECWSTLQPRLPFVELLWCQSRDHHQVVFKVQKQRWCYVKKKKKILFSLSDVFPQKQRRRQSRLKRERKSKHFLIILKRRQTHTELQWTERWHLGWSCDQSVVSPLNSVIEFIWGVLVTVLVTGSSPGLVECGVSSELLCRQYHGAYCRTWSPWQQKTSEESGQMKQWCLKRWMVESQQRKEPIHKHQNQTKTTQTFFFFCSRRFWLDAPEKWKT